MAGLAGTWSGWVGVRVGKVGKPPRFSKKVADEGEEEHGHGRGRLL